MFGMVYNAIKFMILVQKLFDTPSYVGIKT